MFVDSATADHALHCLCFPALQCGAHARSLQYFETHVRAVHGGALNPAAYRSATYDDAEVSYLQVCCWF